jgi:hypothetical protein
LLLAIINYQFSIINLSFLIPAFVRASASLRRNPFIGSATIELWFTIFKIQENQNKFLAKPQRRHVAPLRLCEKITQISKLETVIILHNYNHGITTI